MNPLDPRTEQGTIGELLVIIRLLEYDIQASFTLKDSGNDLLAVKGQVLKAIQVKSSVRGIWNDLPGNSRKYHILALVSLAGRDTHVDLDKCRIYLLKKEEISLRSSISESQLEEYSFEKRIGSLFAQTSS